ncbi:MAG: hypothetical protein AAGJ93_16820, partial [Bacteroidota bacterium]
MRYFILITSLVFVFNGVTAQPSDDFVIRDVSVYQPSGFLEGMDVLVSGGVIKQVAKQIATEKPEVAGEGYTLLPGLVNAHVHSWLPYHLYNAAWSGVM